MKKKIILLLILSALFIIYIYFLNICFLPDNIVIMQGEKINLIKLFGINITNTIETISPEESVNQNVGKKEYNVCLFDNIFLKQINVSVVPNVAVVPLGNIIGLKLYTSGVLVVGMTEIEGKKPYNNTGLEEGDRIIEVNNTILKTSNDLIESVNNSNGNEIKIKYISLNNEEKTVNITPVKTKENEYKLGLWVRDAAAGIGTLTFYEPQSNMFASLGHGVTDIDTGNLITIADGELVDSNIVGIQKGENGKPGEIRGSIDGTPKIGTISKNTNFGIFGKVNNKSGIETIKEPIQVASRNEIKIGRAQIICELENDDKRYYDIEIEKIFLSNNSNNKSMLIRITDKDLLEKTGGIIQGMSGSPIIQDNKFIGAVTHVLINDPTQGYAVFADMMIKQMREVE